MDPRLDLPSRTNQPQIASFLRKFAVDTNGGSIVRSRTIGNYSSGSNNNSNNNGNGNVLMKSLSQTVGNTNTSTINNVISHSHTALLESKEVVESITLVLTLSSKVIDLCIKDDKSITNSPILKSICQAIQDYFIRYQKQLNLLSSSNSIKIAIQSIINSLATAENILKEALETNFLRSTKFKPQLAPILVDLQNHYGGLSAAISFSLAELGDTSQYEPIDEEMAEIRLGDRYFFGHGYIKNYELSLKYYLSALKKSPNNTLALRSVASMYLNGWGVSENIDEAFTYFMKGAELGDPESMNFIGQLYDLKNVLEPENSFTYYQRAADLGHLDAITNLGSKFEESAETENEAMQWYLKAAEEGYAKAQNKLGFLYYKQNKYNEAVSASMGHSFALNNLGLCYELGHGVEASLEIAMQMYYDASKQGHVAAICNLGYLHLKKKEYEEASNQFNIASERGCLPAMYHLGQMHEFGLGFDKDSSRAYRLYSISANKGYALSQLRAGNCLFAGAGTEQKVQEAFSWYKKASAQGLSDADNAIALMFQHGIGTEQDFDQAKIFFDKAVVKGNYDAMFNLSVLYEQGLGVPVNLEKAKSLVTRAAKGGCYAAKKYLMQLESEDYNVKKNDIIANKQATDVAMRLLS